MSDPPPLEPGGHSNDTAAITHPSPMLAFHPRAASIAWTVALVGGVFALLYAIRNTLFVFVLAVFVAYALYPPVRLLLRVARRRLSRTAATTVVFAVLAILIGGVFAFTGPLIADQTARLTEQLPALSRDPNMLERLPLPDWLAPYRTRVMDFIREHADEVAAYAGSAAKGLGSFVLNAGALALLAVLIPILAFMMITTAPAIREGLLQWTRGGEHPMMWQRIVDDLDTLLGGYIRALLVLTLATMVIYSVVFSIAGVPYGLLLALAAGALEFIPVVGPLAGAILCLAVAGFGGYDHLWLLIFFMGIYRLFQDYVLNPYLMSNSVAVPPLLVLFGLLAGEELAGLPGIFLSTPVLAAAIVFVQRIVEQTRREAPATQAVPTRSPADEN